MPAPCSAPGARAFWHWITQILMQPSLDDAGSHRHWPTISNGSSTLSFGQLAVIQVVGKPLAPCQFLAESISVKSGMVVVSFPGSPALVFTNLRFEVIQNAWAAPRDRVIQGILPVDPLKREPGPRMR